MIKLNSINYINGIINLPGSKSISNRILLIASLSKNKITVIKNFLFCDDTYYMIKSLITLGLNIKIIPKKNICIINTKNNLDLLNLNKININPIRIYVENAGTVMRFLTSVLSILPTCNIILEGNDRMKERPIKDLIDALQQGGAIINYLNKIGYPPIQIKGGFLGGKINIKGNISSQFISALFLAAPLAKKNTYIFIKNIISKPYINITNKLLKLFNIKILNIKNNFFYIKKKQKFISPEIITIEGDATAATYFISAASIKGGKILINGIGKYTLQGDIEFINLLKIMGAKIIIYKNFIICYKYKNLKGIHADMNHIPDAAMTIAAISPFLTGTIMIKNIYNWQIKETNRLLVIYNILKYLGLKVYKGKSYIFIIPNRININNIIINSYNDHRIAMCFSLLSLLPNINNIFIKNSYCINKTFPKYFMNLNNLDIKK